MNSEKMDRLKKVIEKYGKLLIAFSGGVDSSFLLAVSREVLKDNLLAVTGVSSIHPEEEIKNAVRLAESLGVMHIVHPSREMSLTEFLENNEKRCYFCKKSLIEDLIKIGSDRGFSHIAHGANLDDLADYRPGLKAADESGVKSPLIEAGLTKEDIRLLSRKIGLETWNKPAQPCLATRLPYGTPITVETLKKVDQAEKILEALGISISRVRHHGEVARIEVFNEDFKLIFKEDNRKLILDEFRKIGYLYIALDLEGYRQGSMNRSLK
jgi:pyridinium-3,5-biscarboxylic acid mononucleotide sulfurtransferase